METRIRVTTPFGSSFKTAPAFLSAQTVWPFRDKATMNIQYPNAGVNANLFGGECEAVFEYHNGTAWVEPLDSRFRLKGSDRDRLDRTQTRRFDFIALMPSMLESAYVWEDAGLTTDTEGNIVFSAVSPGRILRTLFLNAQARGWGAALSMDFTDTLDSNGAAWAGVINLTVDPAQSLYEILSALGNQGVVDWAGQGRTLRVFNPDTTLGRDRPSVRLLAAQGETAAPEQVAYDERATVLRVVGEAGVKWDRANGSSPWGRLESIMSAGGVEDQGTAFLMSDETLLKASGARVSRTREFDGSSKYLPHRDYRAGDHVTYQTDTGTESMRVYSMSINIDSRLTGYSVLGDRFEDALIKAARKQNSLVVGRVQGGNGQQPSKPGDFRTPAAPAGFIGSSSAYMDAEGNEQGRVSLGWTHTGKATDGTAIDIDRFEFRTKESILGGSQWRSFRSVDGADRAATFSPVRTRREDGAPEIYDFQIRAVSAAARVSPWVTLAGLLMETDTTPPPVPSALTAIPSYVTASVAWDGRGAGNEEMPPDFSHVEGEVGASPTGPWVFFGSYDRAASQSIPFALTYGMHWLRARSVDRTGNKSEWSELSTVEIRPLVTLPDIDDLIDDYNQKFAQALADAGIAINSANSKNRIKHSTSTPSTDGGERVGDVWFQYNNAQMTVRIGTWQWNGTAYVPATFGHQTLDSIDLAKATVGMLDGVYIKAKTLNAYHINVGDFTNLCTIDPVLDVNVTIPAAFTTVSAGGYTYKADGGSDYLMFKDQTGPVPFKSGDWLRVTFDAMATTDTTIPTTVYVYPNSTGTAGSLSASGDTITVTPTVQHYSFDIQVPNLDSIGGGKSWTMGLAGAGARAIGVKNVVVYKKVDATTIAPDSIRTPHLGADIIEGRNIKGNTIEGDNMKAGFADFIVMTGSLVQTVAAANQGIKIVASTNRFSGFNAAGDETFALNGNNGDLVLGKGGTFRVTGSSGNVNIGNGKLTVNGTSGDLAIGGNVFTVNGSSGDLSIGNGKMTVNGTTGAIVVADASITGAQIVGGRIDMLGTGAGTGFNIRMLVDGYGMAAMGLSTPNSDTSATIRAHQVGAEGGAIGDEYDQGPYVKDGATQLVIRSPRRTGVTTDRCVMWLQSWEGNNGAYNQPRVVIRGDLMFTGGAALYGNASVRVDAASGYNLDVGVDAIAVRSTVVRDRPYTGAANVYVTENGFLGQTSSAARFKLDQRVMNLPDELLEIPVKDWIDRTSNDELAEMNDLGVRTREQQELIDHGYGRKRTPGVVAEDVAAVKGGNSFVTHDAEGQIQGVAYDRLNTAQIAVLTRQLKAERARNNKLETRLAALEKKMG